MDSTKMIINTDSFDTKGFYAFIVEAVAEELKD